MRGEAMKIMGSIAVFVFVGKFRTFRIGMKGSEDPFATNLLARTIWCMIAYLSCHLVSIKLIFDSALYIRLRLAYESNIKFDRRTVNQLHNDYPFAHKLDFLYNDLEVRNRLTRFDRPNQTRPKTNLETQEEVEQYVKKKNMKFLTHTDKD